MTQSARAITPSPVIIIYGCPRSGTTLLQFLIAERFSAAVMPETHFIPIFKPFLFLWRGLGEREEARRDLARAIYDFIEIRLAVGSGFEMDRIRSHTLLATRPHLDDIVDDATSYSDLVERMFDDYRALNAVSAVCEKTAYYAPVPIDRLADVLPRAKVIHLVRDGRDVALSWRKTWFGPKRIAEAARLWAAHVREGFAFEEREPERCITVRYEDILAGREEVFDRLEAFLGDGVNSSSARASSAPGFKEMFSALAEKGHFANVVEDVKEDNLRKWVEEMGEADRALVEQIAGTWLARAGYDLTESGEGRRPGVTGRLRLIFARIEELVRPVAWQRRMMRLLPAALWASARLGIDLSRLLLRFAPSDRERRR